MKMSDQQGRLGLYSIRDVAGRFFHNPYFAESDGVALRNFRDALKGPDGQNSLIGRYPSQFEIFRVGNFDPQTGHVREEEIRTLGLADQFSL